MSRWRHVIKNTLVVTSIAVGAISLAAVDFVAYSATGKQDSFALSDAEFADVGYLERIQSTERNVRSVARTEFSVYAHRLKRGSGMIFALREYSPGKFSVIDDETYRKVTVWIADAVPRSGTAVPLDAQQRSRVIVSEGASAWPRSGCSRIATAGEVRVQPAGKRFTVTIHADTAPLGDPMNEWCKSQKLDLSFDTKEIRFDDLTPWLGKQGRHPYDETYR